MVERRLEREAWQRERDEIKREIEREREQVREERKREEKERKGKQNPFAGCSISAFNITVFLRSPLDRIRDVESQYGTTANYDG